MSKRFLIFLLLVLCYQITRAQESSDKLNFQAASSVVIADSEGLPFWLQANRLGALNGQKGSQGFFSFNAQRFHYLNEAKNLSLNYGADVLYRFDGNSSIQFQQYWGRVGLKKWYFHIGAMSEPEFAGGLSITNGNLYLSNNARPMPRAEFGFNDLRIFKAKILEPLSFNFLYSEFLLLDDRYVENPHLHRKKLTVGYELASSWEFSFEFDHWVFWGGRLPDGFKMPGIKRYFRYISSFSGGTGSLENEENNVFGNHLGYYQIGFKHHGLSKSIQFYWQHPWEDGSGVKKVRNISDGLLGVSVNWVNDHALFTGLVVEYLRTKHQSGSIHGDDPNRPGKFIGGRDNYFNHGIYRSGFVSYGRMIGLPLMFPTLNENGISTGFNNNRLWGLHSGVKGFISDELGWKGQVTYSQHFGTYAEPYESKQKLLSLGFELNWLPEAKPLSYFFKVAYDSGEYLGENFGVEFKVNYQLGTPFKN